MTVTVDTADTVKRVQRRSTATERSDHIAGWREAGWTQAAYCAQHGINATTFSGWLATERRVGALASRALTDDTALTPVQPPQPPQPPSAPRTLTAVAVKLPTAPLMSTVRSVRLNPCANSTASAASSSPARAHAIELTAATRWRIGLSDAVSPRWLAGLLRALDECDPNPNPNPFVAASNGVRPARTSHPC